MSFTKVSIKTPISQQPPYSLFPLWEHQKRMVTRCLEIEESLRGTPEPIGIMADKPGTGKTFTALSLILHKRSSESNIIVVPQNIFEQWNTAIKTFCDLSKIRYKSFTTYSDIAEIYKDKNVFNNLDIILTTSLYYHLVSGSINGLKIKINRVFFDEIDTIQSMIREPIQCGFIWFISASFKDDKIGCYKLNDISNRMVVCDEEVISRSLNLKPPVETQIPCYNLFTEMVTDILPQRTISELNALDFNTTTYKFITTVPANEKEYLEYLLEDLKEIISNNSINIENISLAKREMEESGFFTGFILQQKSQSFSNQMKTSESNIMGARALKQQLYERLRDKQICPISFANLENGNKVISKCCKMCYSKECIKKDMTCNLCEAKLKYPGSFLEEKKLVSRKPKETRVYKIDELKKLIDVLDRKKNIIFSDFPAIFKELEEYLKSKKIEFITLDGGSIESINGAVKQYKNGPTSYLLVDSSMNGCGMNFENTDNIIFIHKTNPELEKQVVGRAQRPGRKTVLNIYRLLHANEKI
jgi:SNF2 family DNA or RNA helicase